MQTKRADVETSNNKRTVMNTLFDTSKSFDLQGIPMGLFVLIAITSVAILQLDELKTVGVVGAFAVLWTIGLFFYALGERVKLLKSVLGGGLVVAYFGAALTANSGAINTGDIKYVQSFIIENRFLYFVLAALLISSIISVKTEVLKAALMSYAPIILGGLSLAAIFGVLAGMMAGVPTERVLIMYFLPIMGGGTGAGAIPMSEVYAEATGNSAADYFNYAIGVLTLGNIVAIITASSLNMLGNKLTFLSGKGQLVKGQEDVDDELKSAQPTDVNTHAATVLVVSLLLVGVVLSATVGLMHLFAWVTVIAVVMNLTGVVSDSMKTALLLLSQWCIKAFLVTILAAFGLSADFEVIAQLFDPGSLFIIVSIVLGAAIGAGVVAHFVKCYPIEGALAGGLCMANAGGAGDLQVLSAARRLSLYPYAQISSRIGGALMLVLASYFFKLFT
ncbi:2-hydroxycarboxylate transporter family protein [Paraglaciecola sp. T6c]|uniref:2-hydroxycarboxylate transporter family protein n=1 Tax=Pseudoalteromonas atlantica (strain T6c / ATCC BAA-1087) TaxID=3042615 RepID=UPI0005A0ED04|nr:2-hydroxycarboxylate transporter family protein [Paraglaciecola sp. T6c]